MPIFGECYYKSGANKRMIDARMDESHGTCRNHSRSTERD